MCVHRLHESVQSIHEHCYIRQGNKAMNLEVADGVGMDLGDSERCQLLKYADLEKVRGGHRFIIIPQLDSYPFLYRPHIDKAYVLESQDDKANMSSGSYTHSFVGGDSAGSKCCDDYDQHNEGREREAGRLAIHTDVHDHNHTRGGGKRSRKNVHW